MDYNFDAPNYCRFDELDANRKDEAPPVLGAQKTSHDDEAQKANEVAIAHGKTSSPELASSQEINSDQQPQQSQQQEEIDYSEDCATEEIVVHNAPQKRTPQRNKSVCQAVRQSPRLAAIAKSIRRSNASRGLLPGTSRSSGGGGGHRRSLSEGSRVLNRFTKVEKRQSAQRKVPAVKLQGSDAETARFYQEDVQNLSETTQFKKTLSTNRQRAANKTCNKGPMKPLGTKTGPTKPVEFSFATDARIKPKVGQDEPPVDFTKTLRSDAPQAHDRPQGTTKVKPFNFIGPTSKPKDDVQPFLSMAELNMKYLTKTPQRFRTKRSNEPEFPKAGKKACTSAPKITQPATPNLSTRLRARSVDLPTREEIEEKELEEAKKHQFKAKPFNKKILENQMKPVENTEKSITTILPFNITDTRKEIQKKNAKFQKVDEVFVSSVCLASIPHGGIETVWEKKPKEVKPFSFHSRDMEMMRKKQEKIKKMIEEEKKKAEFHAHPMPIFDAVKGLPPKKAPTPTKVQPFNLLSDVRGLTKQQALQRELEALEEEMNKQRKFEARPDTVLHQEPFIPQKSNKPLTDISTFTLNTDKRAEERHAFEVALKEKEDELTARKKELEERQRAEEEARIQEMRRQAVHKAQPIRRYKPVEVKQGVLPVTCPVSPKFATDQRLKTKTTSKMALDSTHTLVDVSTVSANSTISQVDGTFTKAD